MQRAENKELVSLTTGLLALGLDGVIFKKVFFLGGRSLFGRAVVVGISWEKADVPMKDGGGGAHKTSTSRPLRLPSSGVHHILK